MDRERVWGCSTYLGEPGASREPNCITALQTQGVHQRVSKLGCTQLTTTVAAACASSIFESINAGLSRAYRVFIRLGARAMQYNISVPERGPKAIRKPCMGWMMHDG